MGVDGKIKRKKKVSKQKYNKSLQKIYKIYIRQNTSILNLFYQYNNI